MALPFNPDRYDHVYGFHLLDDIHNLFPEFLYDTGLFPGTTIIPFFQMRVHELFPEDYVRMRAQYRMYQMERRREAVIPTQYRTPVRQHVQHVQHPATRRPARPRRNAQPRTPEIPETTGTTGARTTTSHYISPLAAYTIPIATLLQPSTTTDTFTSMFASAFLGRQDIADLLTPVPIQPTEAQLNAASLVSTLEPAADVTCPICQDHTHTSSSEWRILRHCGHRFHRPCIDTWFQQHVQCPVCRHDIREP